MSICLYLILLTLQDIANALNPDIADIEELFHEAPWFFIIIAILCVLQDVTKLVKE